MIQRMGRVLRRKPDGRVAHLIIVYAAGTVEDPALGAHDGFLDEITPVATAVHRIPPGQPLDPDTAADPAAHRGAGPTTTR